MQGPNGTTTVTVPASIPAVGGITTWSRTFSLSLSSRPLVAYLHFEGIVHTAVVLLNGTQVGTLVALQDTRIDVSTVLNYNGSNQLTVLIDDRLTSTTVPGGPTDLFVPQFGALAYEFPIAWVWNPGIVRNVSLVTSDHAVITDAFAQTTFNTDLSTATVHIRVRPLGAPAQALVATAVIEDGGVNKGICLALADANNELSCSISISSPNLWSPSNPHLYDVLVTLYDDSGVVDGTYDRVGLRKFEIRGNLFYLNNQRVFLRGISRHDLYGSNDLVASDATIDSDLRAIKALDANFVRTIHYPPDARVAQKADEIGLLISEEIPAWAIFADPGVIQIAQGMVKSMIERDMNRASVIMWFTGSGRNLNSAAYYAATAATAKSVDPQRPVSFVFDDGAYQVSQIQANVDAMRAAGMSLYAQNAYWPAYIVDQLVPAMPTDLPVVFTEWTGGEGSDRGPVGEPGVKVFPDYYSADGYSSEILSAQKMFAKFNGLAPHVCTASVTAPCLSGIVYFTWQDVKWPAIFFFMSLHYLLLQNGLVYEDRTPKPWPQAIFYSLMHSLPH